MKNKYYIACIALLAMFGCKKDIDHSKDVIATTDEIVSVVQTSATIMATAYGEGITDRGVCWAETSDTSYPTIADSSISDGSGTGSFTVTIDNLEPETNYTVRAYATKTDGKTVYGSSRAVKTLSPLSAEIISAAPATNSIEVKAKLAGADNIVLSESGVCYGTSPDPTVSGTHIKSTKKVLGEFNVTITGLESVTKYYIRAYAVSDGKTVYSDAVEVTTLKDPFWAALVKANLNYGIIRKEGTVSEVVPNSNPAQKEEVTGPLFLMHYSINVDEEKITVTYIETDGDLDAKHVTKDVIYDKQTKKLSWEKIAYDGDEFNGMMWDGKEGFTIDATDGLTLDVGITTKDAKALFSGGGEGGFGRVSTLKRELKYHKSLEPLFNSVELPNDAPIEFNAGYKAIVGMPANGHGYLFRKIKYVESKIAGDKLAFEFDSYDTSQGWMESDATKQNAVAAAMAPILNVWEGADGVIVIKERKSDKTFQVGGFQLYMISPTGPEWFQLYLRNAADK